MKYYYYRCVNCYFCCTVWYPFGTMAEASLDCPNCGTGWLNKTDKGGGVVDYTFEDGKLRK
jgi:hypothetical protein